MRAFPQRSPGPGSLRASERVRARRWGQKPGKAADKLSTYFLRDASHHEEQICCHKNGRPRRRRAAHFPLNCSRLSATHSQACPARPLLIHLRLGSAHPSLMGQLGTLGPHLCVETLPIAWRRVAQQMRDETRTFVGCLKLESYSRNMIFILSRFYIFSTNEKWVCLLVLNVFKFKHTSVFKY